MNCINYMITDKVLGDYTTRHTHITSRINYYTTSFIFDKFRSLRFDELQFS